MSEGRHSKRWNPGPRSLFGQIAVTMACFVMALLVVVYIFSLYRNSREMEEQMVDSAWEVLEQSCGGAEQMLDNLCLLLNSTLMSPDVIPLAISPDMRDFGNIRTITDALTSAAGSSTLIDAAYLYSVREDLGLSSDYTRSNYQDYSYAAVLSRFQTRKSKLVPYEAHGATTYIYTENSDVYLIQGFSNIRYDKCSCYVLFHLDSEQFYRAVNPTGDAAIQFFNSAGGRIFAPQDADREAALYRRVSQEKTPAGHFLYDWGDGSSSYAVYRSGGWTGWTCVYMTKPVNTLVARYLHSNLLLALAVLLLGGFCVMAILWSARRISRPISELVKKVQSSAGEGPAPDSQSEWEYLEQTYSHLLSQKEELERYLPLAAESLHVQIFRALLRQEELSRESVGQQLALIHSPFTPETPCAVFLAAPQSAGEEASDQLSLELILLGLRGRLERRLTELGVPFHVQVQGDLCLICALPPEGPVDWETLRKEVLALSGEKDALIWGAGSPSADLMHLSDSLAEARSGLEFNRYYADQPAVTGEGEYPVYIGKIRELLGTLRREDAEGLQTVLHKLLQDISATFSPPEARQLYQLLLDLLLEQAAALKADCAALDPSLQTVPDGQLRQRTEELCQEIVRRLQGRFSSSQQQYVERAREYILARYTDPNLSLESAAEYVGINAAYLSRLFKSIAQQNFSAYLNQCRVDNAKRLLRGSEMPAQEIGYLTGFCSVATFFRVFKKQTGMTPKQFRQNIQEEGEAP